MSENFQKVQREFCAHLRNPQRYQAPNGIEARRLKIYRELLFNNVYGFVSRAFPVIKKILGEQNWLAMVEDFFERHHSHSPFFSEIAEEFLDYLQHEREQNEASKLDPPFLLQLAHYEWSELALEINQQEIPRTGFNPQGDLLKSQIVFSPLAWVLHYQWPVHKISPDFIPTEMQDCFLIVYRNKQDNICFIETNAISARLLTLIQENETLTGNQILEILLGELQVSGQEFEFQQLQQHAQTSLNHLRDLDIILGTRLNTIR